MNLRPTITSKLELATNYRQNIFKRINTPTISRLLHLPGFTLRAMPGTAGTWTASVVALRLFRTDGGVSMKKLEERKHPVKNCI